MQLQIWNEWAVIYFHIRMHIETLSECMFTSFSLLDTTEQAETFATWFIHISSFWSTFMDVFREIVYNDVESL